MHSHRITTSDDDADSESKKVGEAIVSWKPSLWKSQTNLVLRKSNPSGRIGGWIVSYFYWENFYPGSSWDCTLRIRMNGLKRWWRGWTRMPLVFSKCRLMLIQSWIEASSLNICPIIQYDALEPPHGASCSINIWSSGDIELRIVPISGGEQNRAFCFSPVCSAIPFLVGWVKFALRPFWPAETKQPEGIIRLQPILQLRCTFAKICPLVSFLKHFFFFLFLEHFYVSRSLVEFTTNWDVFAIVYHQWGNGSVEGELGSEGSLGGGGWGGS